RKGSRPLRAEATARAARRLLPPRRELPPRPHARRAPGDGCALRGRHPSPGRPRQEHPVIQGVGTSLQRAGRLLRAARRPQRRGDEHGAAITYHQLGIVAQERRDLDAAEKWYLKSLAIKEKQGNEHGAASTYHQLGSLAEERRDFDAAKEWYLKSLAISEKQGN